MQTELIMISKEQQDETKKKTKKKLIHDLQIIVYTGECIFYGFSFVIVS